MGNNTKTKMKLIFISNKISFVTFGNEVLVCITVEIINNKFIENRIALVTGASAGIGKGIAYKLAINGAKVVFAARRMDRLAAITEELRNFGAVVYPVEMDVCNKNSVRIEIFIDFA